MKKSTILKYITKNPAQTKKIGELLAKKILETKPSKLAFLLGLEGDLGGGKTTFLQGFAKGAGIKQKILSPTFVIMKKFQMGPKRSLGGWWEGRSPNYKSQTNSKFQIPKFKTFYHIDCYRILKPKEILDLGFKKIISNPQNIVAIEWAEKIRSILPKDIIKIQFSFISKNIRQINIKCMG